MGRSIPKTSPTGSFDIGLMTADALRQLECGESREEADRRVWEARSEGGNAGNGSLMRCAPYATAYRDRPAELVDVSRQSSSIIHAYPRCQWSCALFNRTLANLLNDVDRPLEAAVDDLEAKLPTDVYSRPLSRSSSVCAETGRLSTWRT